MTDTSNFQIPLGKSLTSDMQYGLKPSCPKSRSYRMNLPAMNKSVFVGGDQVIFEIPTGRKGTYLDQSQSYYKFSVQCSSTAAAAQGGAGIYLDNTAYSFLQRQDIYHSSNLLETQNEVGQMANFLIDNTLSQSQKAGLSSMIGSNPINSFASGAAAATTAYTYNPYGFVSGSTLTAAAAGTSGTVQVQTAGDRSGLSLASVSTASGVSTATAYTFSLPIISGVIGVNASKMLPLGHLGSPVRVELYLSANDDAIYYGVAGAGAAWQIVNFELVLCFVEIDEEGFDHAEPVTYISTQSYRQTSATLAAASSGEFTTLLPFRFVSMTALYARFRNCSAAVQGVNASAAYRKSSSINPCFGNYYLRVGGAMLPNKPVYLMNGSLVNTGAEAFAELQKSFHSMASITGDPAFKYNEYNVSAAAMGGWVLANVAGAKTSGVIDTFSNAFMIGQELQTFSNRNDTILSGISTQNTQMYFTGTIYTGQTSGASNITCDFFAQYDMILVIQDGIMRAVF